MRFAEPKPLLRNALVRCGLGPQAACLGESQFLHVMPPALAALLRSIILTGLNFDPCLLPPNLTYAR